jgi:UDP-2,3-diacylglucosamine pyrophosphatase LpxH
MDEPTIAVLSDIHLGPAHEDDLFATLQNTLDRIQSHATDKILVLGDIVQETDMSTDERLLTDFIKRLDATGVPYRCLAGNHDVEELSYETYETVVGHDSHGTIGDAVMLDSAAPHLSHGRGEVSDAQLEFLATELPALTEPLIFVHHPIHYHDIRDNRWFGRLPEAAFCGNKEAVLDVLHAAPTDVAAVINGHLHEWDYTEYRGIHHFTIDAFNKCLEPEHESGSFALLERGERLRVTQYRGDGSEHSVCLPT